MAGGLASSAVYLAFSTGEITDLDWYRMPQLLALCVGLGVAWTRIGVRAPRPATILAGAAVVVVVPALLWVQYAERVAGPNHDFWHPVEAVSRHVGRAVPPGGVVATVDYPGVVAAFSGRRVVALDGLTGDYAFQDDLRDHGLCALRRRGVRWLVVDDESRLRSVATADGTGYDVEITSWLHAKPAGLLRLEPGDRVFADPTSGLSLWRVDPPCPP
jgi:hypothetical protein